MLKLQDKLEESALAPFATTPALSRRFLDIAVGSTAVLLLALLGLAVWAPHVFPAEQMLISSINLDANVQEGMIHPSLREMQRALHRNEFFAALLIMFAAGLYYARRTAAKVLFSQRTFQVAVWAACTASVSVALMSFGHEGDFSPVTALMQRPADYPITGNRLFMVWIADFFKWMLPSFSYLRCYLLSQVLATGAAMCIIGRWCVMLFGERYRTAGQVLLTVALTSTIIYYTFYDIAMVFFYTLSLIFLYRRRYALFTITLALGTTNHENTLLLVLVAAAVLYGTVPFRTFLLVPSISFLAWLSVRALMQHIMPIHGHFEMHIWTNLLDMAGPSQALGRSAALLVFWWVASLAGMKYAPPFLRRALILLPALVAVTFVVGKFIEARQWDAFLPVGIALILSYVSHYEATTFQETSISETEDTKADRKFWVAAT